MTRIRPVDVRFYVDADLMGLAKVLADSLRLDVTYPGDPGRTWKSQRRLRCPVTREQTDDTDWIPVIADHGWLAITRDHGIQQSLSELTAVREAGLKMVALAGEDARNVWPQLKLVMQHWERIELAHGRSGPFILRASASQLRHVEIDANLERLRRSRRSLSKRRVSPRASRRRVPRSVP